MLGWRVVLPALKRVIPLPSLVRLMWSDGGPPALDREAVVRLAEVAYEPGPDGARGNCLERSLVAYRYLAQLRADPTLVVGVDRSGSEVRGHVWVLVDGVPVHDSPERVEGHTALVCFGPGGERTGNGGASSSLARA
jgi:transglutaminase superfamily protein